MAVAAPPPAPAPRYSRRSRRSVSSFVLPEPAEALTKADTRGSLARCCSASARAAAPAAPAAPVTRFDGRYTGPLALLPDRTRRCPEAPLVERVITVRNGRAALALNPQVQQQLTGTVGADGSARMADSLDRTIATSGVFSENGFRGEHRNGLCSYSVRMTKRD